MRIIDKVIKENHNLTKFEIIAGTCPSRWGYKDIESDKCGKDIITCANCWKREVDE